MKKIIKDLKPIEVDASFIYCCPSCGCKHWVNLKQARTKKFLIVCDCDTTFTPKTIKKIKIAYKKKNIIKLPNNSQSTQTNNRSLKDIPDDLLNRCSTVLVDYGFTKEEAKNLIQQAYESNPSSSLADLVKICLSNFGEKHG